MDASLRRAHRRGRATCSSRARPSSRRPSLRRIVRWFGVPVANADGSQCRSVKGSSPGRGAPLPSRRPRSRVDGNEAAGTLAFNLAGEHPADRRHAGFQCARPDALLRGGALAVLRLRPPHRLVVGVRPLVSAPQLLRCRLAPLRAARSWLKGYGLGRGAATIAVRSGKLLANIAELELPTGTASAPDHRQRQRVRAALRAARQDRELRGGPGRRRAVRRRRADRPLDALRRLAAAGQTPAEVLRRLSGKVALTMAEGGTLALGHARPCAPRQGRRRSGLGRWSRDRPARAVEARARAISRRRARRRATCRHARGRSDYAAPPAASICSSARSTCACRCKPSAAADKPLKRRRTWRAPRP